jgi:serine/threonine protein kinase
MAQVARDLLFICYSHTDKKYREQFQKYLKADAVTEVIRIWADTEITEGADWQKEIIERLDEATAALVLISQDTLISPFIQQVELRAILESHVSRGLRLFLVPLAPTLYQGSTLERFQWALPPDKPLSSMSENDQQEAIVQVCRRIAKQIGTMPDTPTIERTIECLKSVPRLDLPSTYKLEKPLGEGRFSRCFRGRDTTLNRPVVIKILNTPLERDSAAYDKYVASASKLDHRSILGIYFSEANKLPNFIVTPDVGDDTLEEKLADPETRPAHNDALRWIVSLAGTLAYAHDQGCVHGRLRPCEIRFHRERPILTGFRTIESCAKEASSATAWRWDLDDFRFASPEYRERGVVDAKGDQYQLGLIAYEVLSGVSPVPVTSWASLFDPAVLAAVLNPRPLKDVVPHGDARVSDVVMRMLSSDPNARWPSMREVEQRLEDALTNATSVAVAKESYRRFAQDVGFYDELYKRLFQKIPGIETMFKSRSMAEQRELLRNAVWLLLTYASVSDRGEPTILSRVAEKHHGFPDEWFDSFGTLVLELVEERDRASLDAWRYAMAPGLAYLKAHAGNVADTASL